MNTDPSAQHPDSSRPPQIDRALLDFMLASTEDAVACIALDGTIVALTRGAETLIGYDAKELVGRNMETLFPMFVTPDRIAAEREIITRVMAGEDVAPYESKRTRKDGSTIHILVSASPIRNARGDIVGVARVLRDITQRKAQQQDKGFLAEIVNSSTDGIISYSLDGTLVSWNPGAERMFGYTAAEMIGTGFDERIRKLATPEHFGVERSVMQRAARGEYVPPFEALRTRKDGSFINVLASVSPVRDEQGKIIGVARIVRDITERKAHEQDRALLGQIVHSSSDAIISYRLDGTITSWNPAAERIYGYSAAEMLGTSLRERIGEFVAAERIAEEIRLADRVIAGERVEPYEAVRSRKDGSTVNVLVAISPIRDAVGDVVGLSRTVRDISERKTGETQKALLSSIVQSSNDAIYTKTLDGTITTWNPGAEELFGYKAEEIIGRPVLLLFRPGDVAEEVQILAQISAGETIRHYETVRTRKDGTRIDVSVTASPLRDPHGKIIGASNIVRDITERKEYETRLKTMQDDLTHVARLNELGQVSAGIAHELNQPLAALLNYANLAKRVLTVGTQGAVPKALDAIAKVSEQAMRAGEIIRRMRSFVEKRQSNRTSEDINSVVTDTIALGFMGADAANVTTRLKLAPHLPKVLADRVQIQQVLVNLLHNAVDAMASSPKRELTLSTSLFDGNLVEVSVADVGTGISKEQADRLFMPFFTTKPGGMGIGLVISRSIIEAHGGKIAIEANNGGGTIVRFTLPASP
jgi:two-component system sensor kinase FixL